MSLRLTQLTNWDQLTPCPWTKVLPILAIWARVHPCWLLTTSISIWSNLSISSNCRAVVMELRLLQIMTIHSQCKWWGRIYLRAEAIRLSPLAQQLLAPWKCISRCSKIRRLPRQLSIGSRNSSPKSSSSQVRVMTGAVRTSRLNSKISWVLIWALLSLASALIVNLVE